MIYVKLLKLVTESDTGHTILDAKNVVIDRIDASQPCAVGG